MVATVRQRNPRGEGDRLRADMLAAASALLDRSDSDDEVTLRAVARAVGVAPQSVYLHFADREELLLAVCEERFAALAAALNTASRGVTDPVELLLVRSHAYCDFGLTHAGLYQTLMEGPLLSSRPLADGSNPGRALFRTLVGNVRAAMDGGGVPAGDPEFVAVQVWTALHGIVSLRVNKPLFDWPPAHELVDASLRGLLGLPS